MYTFSYLYRTVDEKEMKTDVGSNKYYWILGKKKKKKNLERTFITRHSVHSPEHY